MTDDEAMPRLLAIYDVADEIGSEVPLARPDWRRVAGAARELAALAALEAQRCDQGGRNRGRGGLTET